jgi:hypothetical protein
VARDYHAEYISRYERATAEGFDSIHEKTEARREVLTDTDLRDRYEGYTGESIDSASSEDLSAFAAAFGSQATEKDDYLENLGYWFVEILGDYTWEEWWEMYGES